MIDRLIAKIEACGAPIAVGLDPVMDMIPDRIKKRNIEEHGLSLKAAAAALLDFNKEIIDCIWDIAPAVKPQIAMYERFGPEGVAAYAETAAYAKTKGMIVIGDVKRGDIASTAEAYAAHIGGVIFEGVAFDPWHADAVTLNPYMGADAIKPFVEVCLSHDKGIFILVKTSNPSSSEIQDITLAPCGKTVFEHVAGLVSSWGEGAMGTQGYSKVAAVVGATFAEQGTALRKSMPHTFFLIPGYGAQGATGKDIRDFFDSDGRGCLVNSSRGIISAWRTRPCHGDRVGEAAREAAMRMAKDLKL
ncbi:MAG: orotidine-5'-phosphate decarboxylase [Clostridiales Family XIII bacterium]|jgi:orotidine-5'-phosphate decarboxylase|nr:orotidine-5'-phosphate decarboxylase [Clostridiales Family XIII bacterium]